MSGTPIINFLKKNNNKFRFHTPGHSGVDVFGFDITELSYSDNLLDARGAIAECERNLASLYGADNTLIFTAGATTAVLSAIYSVRGRTFIVIGGAHVSVHNALAVASSEAVFCNDSAEAKALALDKNKSYALICTAPDYFGMCPDISELRALADELEAVLIIDASHGSHFMFSSKLPVSASLVGDLVIHSLHKTLPVMTGGALLHAREAYYKGAHEARKIFHSTSPSYPIMASIDLMCAKPPSYDEVLSSVAEFSARVRGVVENDDPTRLVVRTAYDAAELSKALEAKGYFAELAGEDLLVFIVTPHNHDKLTGLADALGSYKGALYDRKNMGKHILLNPPYLWYNER
jgi:arginine/lysine/ornithine decarboxylase